MFTRGMKGNCGVRERRRLYRRSDLSRWSRSPKLISRAVGCGVPSQRITPREGPPTSAAGASHALHMNRGDVLAEVPVIHVLMTGSICLIPTTFASVPVVL